MNKIIPSESWESMALMQWAGITSARYPELRLLFHIPNGGKRGIRTATRMKREGVKAGVPDYFLPAARAGYLGMFIELKREKGGSTSPEQKQWITELRAAQYYVVVAHGFLEASKMITDYLRGRV